MKLKLIVFFILLLIIPVNYGYSELQLLTINQVYSEGEPLFVYGKGQPNETLIIRLIAPDKTIPKFDQFETNEDGTYEHVLMVWPKASSNLPFGTYTIEIISTQQNGLSKKIDVKFTSSKIGRAHV